MTVQNILDFVRFRTNTNPTTATNANLLLSMNERHRQLWLALQDVREDYGGEISTTNLVGGQQEYPFPDESMKIKRVEITYDGVNWKWVKPFDIGERRRPNDATSVASDFSTSEPYFDVHENSLFMFPIPQSSVTNGLKLYHIMRPQDISSLSASPGLPKEHHIWICDLMTLDVEVSRGRKSPIEAQQMSSQVLEEFQRLVSPRNQGEKIRMRSLSQNNR